MPGYFKETKQSNGALYTGPERTTYKFYFSVIFTYIKFALWVYGEYAKQEKSTVLQLSIYGID
jgi:hypothetical protein